MKKLKRGVALLLTALMLISALPATAMAAELEDGTTSEAEQISVDDMMATIMETAVMYMDGEAAVLVVEPQYADWCQENWETLSDAGWFSEIGYFTDDGNYTIQLPDGTAFPCTIAFPNTQDDDPIMVFANTGDAQEVNGHTFVVACENPQETEDGDPGNVDFNTGVNPLGYQYIETVNKTEVDLTGYLAEELKVLPLSVLLPDEDLKNVGALAVATSSNGNGDGQYEVVETEGGTIDLSNLIYRGTYYDYNAPGTSERTLEIINSDDQLNTDAVRYIVPIRFLNLNSLLDLDAYLNEIQIDTGDSENYWYCNSRGSYELNANDDLPIWDIKKTVISIKLNEKLDSSVTNGLTVKVYEGTYRTADDVDADKEITGDIWGQGSGGYHADWTEGQAFTVVMYRREEIAQILNIDVCMQDKGVEFGFDAATVATDDNPSAKFEVSSRSSSSDNKDYYYLTPRNYDTWQSGEAALKLRYKTAIYSSDTDYSDYAEKTDVAVYTGYYENETALNAAIKANQSEEITSNIWAADGEGYTDDYTNWKNRPAFTVVVKEKGSSETAYVVPFYVYMAAQSNSPVQPVRPVQIGVSGTLYVEKPTSGTDGTNDWNRASESHTTDRKNGTEYYTMRYATSQEIKDGHNYPTNGKYYIYFYVSGGSNSTMDSLAEIDRILDKDGNNVKDAMLGSYGYNYYQVDFSAQPVTFTVYFKDKVNETDGTAEPVAPQVIRLRTLPAQPATVGSTASTDTYFNVTGLDGYQTYIMSPHVDSSYQNGFQVLFVDATQEELEANEVTIKYSTGSGVRMFHEHDEYGELIGTTGEVITSVKSGEPVFFSAASESGTHLRNYWVTLIAKGTEGPKLWINGQDDKYHIDSATKLPMREVYIGYGSSGSYYDIFFANIGNDVLEDLTVTLSPNANIRLDDYWTIGDTTILAPFTTVNPADNYSELENMAKIRIWPKDNTSKGSIDAILTISAKDQEPISIKLTGKVGQAAIVSSNVPDGVKYVPYSCLIQTNFQSSSGNASNRPTFQIVGGVLPSGLDINDKTGEIYGVPKIWSNNPFTFTVGIYQGGQLVDSKSFTMHVAENTDNNVWYASDITYEVEEEGWIGDQSNGSEHHYIIDLRNSEVLDPEREDLRTFVSKGPYIYYAKVFLDSNELTRDVDYTHEEGSTKIVLNENTIRRNNTNGDHTLAIEFREGSRSNSDTYVTMKRTAQNYTIEGGINPSTSTPQQPSSNGSSGGSSSSSSGSSGSSSNSNNSNSNRPSNQNPSTTPGKTSPFVDVRNDSWYYNDVSWVWDQELMTGVTSSTFAPDTQISQAMIVVILARLANVDLTAYENVSVAGAAPGAWYTTAAAWAQQTGILPDYTAFEGENGAYSRDGMAIMLVKYMASMGVDTSVGSDIAFDDMDQMSDAGRDAFRVLCHYGVFKGIGDNKMDPTGVTTRAQFAALVHRVSDFVANR